MPEILRDIICLVGAGYMLYHIYNLAASIIKTFSDWNKSEFEEVLSERE